MLLLLEQVPVWEVVLPSSVQTLLETALYTHSPNWVLPIGCTGDAAAPGAGACVGDGAAKPSTLNLKPSTHALLQEHRVLFSTSPLLHSRVQVQDTGQRVSFLGRSCVLIFTGFVFCDTVLSLFPSPGLLTLNPKP